MKTVECEVRLRILLAAKKLFALHGFDRTTVREICQEAKSNLALVSYHFGGKESVFFELFETFLPIDKLSVDSVPDEPEAGVRYIVENLIRFKLEQPEMIAIIEQEIFMNSPRLVEIRKYMFPVYEKLKTLLQNGQKQGNFCYKSTDNAIRLILGVLSFPLNAPFLTPLLSGEVQNSGEIFEDTVNFIFAGLGSTKFLYRNVSGTK